MSGKKPTSTNDVLIKYLDGRFKSLDMVLADMRSRDSAHDEQFDELTKQVGHINVTLAKQEQQLAYHIKRTDLLEKNLAPIKSWFDTILRVGGAIAILLTFIGGVAKLAELWMYYKVGG